jgi:hypothetical protein
MRAVAGFKRHARFFAVCNAQAQQSLADPRRRFNVARSAYFATVACIGGLGIFLLPHLALTFGRKA